MREEKAKLYAQIRTKEISRNSKLYNLNFFRYIPKEKYEEKYEEKNKSKKNIRKRIAHTKKKKYKTY